MHIQVNGQTREVPDKIRLLDLVLHLELAKERIAIERNHKVVRQSEWPTTTLCENDRIEIVHFVGGGAVKIRS